MHCVTWRSTGKLGELNGDKRWVLEGVVTPVTTGDAKEETPGLRDGTGRLGEADGDKLGVREGIVSLGEAEGETLGLLNGTGKVDGDKLRVVEGTESLGDAESKTLGVLGSLTFLRINTFDRTHQNQLCSHHNEMLEVVCLAC